MRRSDVIKKERHNRKIFAATVSLLAGILFFVLLLKIQTLSLESYQTKQVVVATKDIQSGAKINADDLNKYFKIIEVNKDCVTESFYSMNELQSWIDEKGAILLNYSLKKNEIIYADKFSCVDEKVKEYENPVEVGVKVNSFEYCVGGILRTGDILDLCVFNTDTGLEERLEDVLILKAFDAGGLEILPENTESVSVAFNIMMEQSEFDRFNSAFNNGTIRITKKVENN